MPITIGLSPLQQIQNELLNSKGIKLYIKLDDLLHPEVQGNKWRKLKYNLINGKQQGYETLLTFGGAFSNHIYATAAAAQLDGFKSVGIIRSHKREITPTLKFAQSKGMILEFVSGEQYKEKYSETFLRELQLKYGNFYLLPEGGTNELAVKGAAEIINEIEIPFQYICAPCGTGGTLAGILAGLKGSAKVIGFSSLKGEDRLTAEVNELVQNYCGQKYQNFSINFDYHFGGYAKVKPELIEFIKQFKAEFNIQLDPVYTGKMMYGIFELIKGDYFPTDSTIIAVHTGGLQGLSGYAQYFDSR